MDSESKTQASEVLALEKKYWQAMKDKDLQTALQLTDDPCIIAGSNGVQKIDRNKFIEMMNAHSFTIENFELKDAQVRLISDDVAILAYRVNENLILDGKPMEHEASEASTWVKRDGKWLCAMHAEAKIQKEREEDEKIH